MRFPNSIRYEQYEHDARTGNIDNVTSSLKSRIRRSVEAYVSRNKALELLIYYSAFQVI